MPEPTSAVTVLVVTAQMAAAAEPGEPMAVSLVQVVAGKILDSAGAAAAAAAGMYKKHMQLARLLLGLLLHLLLEPAVLVQYWAAEVAPMVESISAGLRPRLLNSWLSVDGLHL